VMLQTQIFEVEPEPNYSIKYWFKIELHKKYKGYKLI